MSNTNKKDHLILVCWNDLCGITRLRGAPSSRLENLLNKGLGWACAGHAITPTGGIVENAWGPLDEARHIPDPAAEVFLPADEHTPALHFFIADSYDSKGNPWDCCPRAFCKGALNRFKEVTGLNFVTAFEHEFLLSGENFMPGSAFTLESTRTVAGFVEQLVNDVLTVDGAVETYEAEYGSGQYELSCGPAEGIKGVDRALIVREVIRESARRYGYRASFTPKSELESVGNGLHVHFSFRDEEGRPASFEAEGPGQLSSIARKFIAGVHHHVAAIMAFAAATPVSYQRLGPGHWSCGYASVGVQNREAALRIITDTSGGNDQGKSHNIEFRPPDSAGNPYLLVGAMIYAGLDGIAEDLPLPEFVEADPHDLDEEQKQRCGVTTLPASLNESLNALLNDKVIADCLPRTLLKTFVAIKRSEIDLVEAMTPAEVCEMYGKIY